MDVIMNILWFVGLFLSYRLVRLSFSYMGMADMFPEGRRWWHGPYAWLMLTVLFAYVVFNPFTTYTVTINW